MSTGVFALFWCLLLSPGLGQPAEYSYVVSENGGKTLDVKWGEREPQNLPPVYAEARLSGNHLETGWTFFQVKTGVVTDPLTARAAGKLEGSLTTDLMSMHWQNTLASYCSDEPDFCFKLGQFVGENLRWMESQIELNPKDAYWYQVSLILRQVEGLKEGYNERKNSSHSDIPDFGFLLMQMDGDLSNLETVLGRKTLRKAPGTGSCSALVKVLPSNKDLLISHVTWNSYDSMLRIFKFYDFTYSPNGDRSEVVPAAKQCFSSYPGLLLSGDDYYMLSSGLVSQETTIENYNEDLWKYVHPVGIVLEWIRNVVANRLATTAAEWALIFSKYNSGTYNNQWMILDYNLFTPDEDLKPGTFVVLEQLPGNVKSADMTGHLKEYGYWASYNLPYFPSIYNKSQQPNDPWFDYHKNPRAQIFARDQGKVESLSTLLKLMRYNDFKNDPLSKCSCSPPYSAENAISARSDLNPADGKYPLSMLGHRKHGGTDAKATNYLMFNDSLSCVAVSGPTYDQQPVFQWSTSGWARPRGHPNKWDFEVQKIQLDF